MHVGSNGERRKESHYGISSSFLFSRVCEVCLTALSSGITGWLFIRLSRLEMFLRKRKFISALCTKVIKKHGLCFFFCRNTFPILTMTFARAVAVNVVDISDWIVKTLREKNVAFYISDITLRSLGLSG